MQHTTVMAMKTRSAMRLVAAEVAREKMVVEIDIFAEGEN